MSETLTNGVIVPDKGSRDWYADLRSNWLKLDSLMAGGDITVNPAQTEGVLVATITVGGKEYKLYQQDGDVSVKIDPSTENAEFPLVASTSAEANTGSVVMAPAVTVNPSTGALTATSFKGKLDGNASTATTATKAVQDGAGAVITDTYATKEELGSKADDADVLHKSGTETIAGTKTFSSQIKGSVSGTSSDVVVGSDTATARGYLVDNTLPWYTWEEGSQLIAGRIPLITDFNNLTKPGVYHVIFCLNDGFVHEEKEYKESLNRPSIPNITTGFRDGILEIKQTSTMHTISSVPRFTQKLTVLSGATTSSYIGLIYQRVFSPYGEWTAWKRVARDEEVVHNTGNETIAGLKTFSKNRTKFCKSLDLYHDEDYKLNTNPSVKAYQYVFFTGKSGWHSAYLENQVDTDGASYCNLSTRNTKEQSASVQLAVDSNGVKTFTWNNANILTDNNQIMLCKNLTGSNIALNGVVDCGEGNEKLKAWYINESNTLTLATTKVTGKWKNISSYMVPTDRSGMFVKVG